MVTRVGNKRTKPAIEVPSYNELLRGWRIRRSTLKGRSLAVEAASDRGRVLFSSAFRNLSQKTQVFSLEGNSSIRTRLTHSLEVAQVGRYLAQLAVERMNEATADPASIRGKEEAFQSFVETACLVHDLGNPPFGHFGERALRHWFEENEGDLTDAWHKVIKDKQHKPEAAKAFLDFVNFDGNPQGFRVLTRLIWNTDHNGLNLTGTQLAATIKYVCAPSRIDRESGLTKKAGFFATEKDIASAIWTRLGLKAGARHPLVYLMEAADDIAYGLSDLEDAIEKGMFTEGDILGEITKEFSTSTLASKRNMAWFAKLLERGEARPAVPGERLLDFRTGVVNKMVPLAAEAFVSNHNSYLLGKERPLLDAIPEAAILRQLNGLAKRRIYRSRIVMRNEIIASRVIKGILDAYKPIMTMPVERLKAARDGEDMDHAGKQLSTENSLIQQIPTNLFRAYDYRVKTTSSREQDLWEPFHRMHLVVDFLSAMTDQGALRFFQLVNGSGAYASI